MCNTQEMMCSEMCECVFIDGFCFTPTSTRIGITTQKFDLLSSACNSKTVATHKETTRLHHGSVLVLCLTSFCSKRKTEVFSFRRVVMCESVSFDFRFWTSLASFFFQH